MDGEDNKKVVLKKRPKEGELKFDSDDDEPIGSLLKLKRRGSKKAKLGVDGEKDKKVDVEAKEKKKDGDFVGMEDTLACFRKKLKGPKKDKGGGNLVKLGSKMDEPPDGGLNRVMEEGLEAELVPDVDEGVADVRLDVSAGKTTEKKHDGKIKRSKSVSPAKCHTDVIDGTDDGKKTGCSSSENQVDCREVFSNTERKQKKVARWSKSSLTAKKSMATSGIHDSEVLDDMAVDGQEEGKCNPSNASDILVESLSSFLKKAQSGVNKKSRVASGSKSKKRVLFSENDPCPTSEVMSVDLQSASRKDSLSDGKINSESHESENHLPDSCQVRSIAPENNSAGNKNLDASCDEAFVNVLGVNPKNINSMINDASSRPSKNSSVQCFENILDHSVSVSQANISEKIPEPENSKVCGDEEMIEAKPLKDSADKLSDIKVHDTSVPDSQDVNRHIPNEQFVSPDALSSEIRVPCSSPTLQLREQLTKPEKNGAGVPSAEVCIRHEPNTSRAAVQDLGNDILLLTSVSDKANVSPSPFISRSENGGSLLNSNQCNERVVRRVKKRKDGDMAYEEDIDWQVLMHNRRLPFSDHAVDKNLSAQSKDKFDSSNIDPDFEKGGAAAVSVGLKARSLTPVENIKFKEVLRRKGGLQQYLECRNKILSLWSKDVTRILPFTDCGITTTPTDKEPFHASLTRDTYSFLDRSGYINIGIAANKDKAETSSKGSYILLGEKKFEENSGVSIADSVDGVSFILGQVKSPDIPPVAKDDVASADESHLKEAADTLPMATDDVASANESHIKEAADTLPKAKDDVASANESRVNEAADTLPKANDDAAFANESHIKEAAETLPKEKDDVASADESHIKEAADTLPKANDDVASANESHIEAADTPSKAKDDVASVKESHIKEASDTLPNSKDDIASAVEIHSKEATENAKETAIHASSNKPLDCQVVGDYAKQLVDVQLPERIARSDCSLDLHGRGIEQGRVCSQPMMLGDLKSYSSTGDFKNQRRIIVVGAGPAGLTAARHLQRQGYSVTVLEARSRIGGRVHTDRSSLSVPVDLGASIITGVEADVASERRPDPSSLICAQLGLELTILNSDCPLYDVVTGQKVPPNVDESLEAEFNSLLDDMMLVIAQKGEGATRMSLEDGLELGLKIRRKVLHQENVKPEILEPLAGSRGHGNDAQSCLAADVNSGKGGTLNHIERRVMDWHFAHLEYGCAALLKDVSLPHWNQDDVYGGFGGAHCMIKGGYGAVVESIAQGLPIHLNQVVSDISYGSADNCSYKVKVSTSNGDEFFGDAVLITVPLGCLKANSINFSPPLPQWKNSAIQRLGFGVLNKVVLEFPEIFWDDSVDYFGATAEHTNSRGHCFMFWNVKKTVGAPVLIALVVGKAAVDGQEVSPSDHVSHALTVLRKLFGHASVPDPVGSVVTNWGKDPFSYGAYSYVAVGASGEDYDIIGRPVEKRLFFAGEATCKEHPDTVGGAMMSGLREAVRIVDILTTGIDYTAEAEAVDVDRSQSNSQRNEVKDIARRLDAISITDTGFTRESLLQDLFFSAKTSAGKLRLAKELLSLPIESLKSFAGTKEGLNILNSWILDSLGKDGTQLLRHCVRILVLVSTDLVAVRLSGIGKTVKEKVCVHTSRDIRSIASQLVTVWIEVFRKEKATNGGLKLLRHMTNADSSKAKGKDPSSRKPPKRALHCAPGNKVTPGLKKMTGKQVKLETHSSISHSLKVGLDSKSEEAVDVPMSEEEQAAIAAAEAAHAAALAAIKAYATSEARSSMMQLPKIPSFQKFARREQYAQMDEAEKKRWSGDVLGRQDCLSEIDSRNCRVRDWSVDFSATCANLENPRLSMDNLSQRSNSNEVPCQLNWREHSGESAAGDNTAFTKAWVESSGSDVLKDYHAIERWQCQAAEAEYEYQSSMHIPDEEDSSSMSRLVAQKHEGLVNESSVSQVTVNNELAVNQSKGTEHIKQGVVDYVASLLMPLYKARKIDKEGYKSIMKKSATKVMEQTTDAEKAMPVSVFLDSKRKNKIRAFVDKLIERHMSMKRTPKP